MACRSAIQDSTSCTLALLMLGREIRTLQSWPLGDPDAPPVPAGPEYASQLQDRLDSAYAYARRHLVTSGVRQKERMTCMLGVATLGSES